MANGQARLMIPASYQLFHPPCKTTTRLRVHSQLRLLSTLQETGTAQLSKDQHAAAYLQQ